MDTQSARIPVLGLGCGAGGMGVIERALAKQPGIVTAYGNPATETLYVVYDPARVCVVDIRRVIEQAGYTPAPPA